MQDENPPVVVAAEQPSVAILAVINLALVVGHSGLPLKQSMAARIRSRAESPLGAAGQWLFPPWAPFPTYTYLEFKTGETNRPFGCCLLGEL